MRIFFFEKITKIGYFGRIQRQFIHRPGQVPDGLGHRLVDLAIALIALLLEHFSKMYLINSLEKDIRAQFPEVNKIFIEPDIFCKR